MASTVLNGLSNPSYTNNTGQNVRIVINFMSNVTSMSWAGVTLNSSPLASSGSGGSPWPVTIGRNLAFGSIFSPRTQVTIDPVTGVTAATPTMSANNMRIPGDGSFNFSMSMPTELMLASGQVFSATCGIYNIVIIPEAG